MKMTAPEGLAGWLDRLAQEVNLIAPREIDGVLLYRPVRNSGEIVWEFTRPLLSIKEAFFPATERLLTIEKIGQQIKLTETLPKGEQVIFGVRPCDARGIKMLEALFTDTEPSDPYFTQRRENTTLIGLACRTMGATCFCTSLGGAPDDPGDMDVMLYEVENGFVIQVMTEKGQALLSRFSLETDDISENESEFRASYLSEQAERIVIPEMNAWAVKFDDPYWEQVSERCLSCRICAYVCPTCRCFDVRDEDLLSGNGHNQSERIRCWDSCAREAYRRIAGGHNPRQAKGQRLRNRFLCKFDYYPRQSALGTAACTGCGRCIDACPVNIDITEVIQHIVEVSQ